MKKSRNANWPSGGSKLKCFESIFVWGVRITLFVVKKGFQPNAAKEFFNVLLNWKFVRFFGNWNKIHEHSHRCDILPRWYFSLGGISEYNTSPSQRAVRQCRSTQERSKALHWIRFHSYRKDPVDKGVGEWRTFWLSWWFAKVIWFRDQSDPCQEEDLRIVDF